MTRYKKKQTSKRNTPWTDADRRRLRTMYEAGSTPFQIAQALDRSYGAIYQQIYNMRKADAKQGYTHVRDESAPTPIPLTDEEQADKLRNFHLYEGVYTEPADEPKPSLWQRIRALFTRK